MILEEVYDKLIFNTFNDRECGEYLIKKNELKSVVNQSNNKQKDPIIVMLRKFDENVV
jgi:hypothetical protein